MKKIVMLPLLALTLSGVGCKNETTEPVVQTPETLEQKQAYAVGSVMAGSFKQVVDDVVEVQGDFDLDMYLQGVEDTIRGNLQIPEEEIKKISEEYRKAFLENKRAKDEAKKAETKKAAEEFLANNKTKEGITVTESGLQYKVINATEGEKPVSGDRVKVLYTGKLINGDVFDTTSGDNQPREFDLNRVVRGWTEGLQLMTKGSKFEFYIPPELGYGQRDMAKIPAGSVLVFEVELLDIIKKDQPKTEEAKKEEPKAEEKK